MKSRMQLGDRVLVEPIGIDATIKRIIPVWRYGNTEPIKVYFDCGLGRTFDEVELMPLPANWPLAGLAQVQEPGRAGGEA
jgi:hypothetical protein